MEWKNALRLGVFLLAMIGLVAPAQAVLKKYDLKVVGQPNSSNVSPNPDSVNPPNQEEDSVALIDSAPGPNPLLRRLTVAWDNTTTVVVPALTQSVFASQNLREGPFATRQIRHQPYPAFTGTGSTAATIRWGTVTGWTVTGWWWCNSNPAVLCSLGMGADEQTLDPFYNSEFYDLGTWFFHSTGFTATPFIWSFFSTDSGNTTLYIRGFEEQDGTVPALPLIAVIVLGASLATGGVVAMRSRDRR